MKLIELTLNQDPPLMEMANLFKSDTGLDYPIWIGRVGGQHGPRVKVSNVLGKWRMNDNFVVSVSKNPRLLTKDTCKLTNTDLQRIYHWIKLNYDDLMLLWWIFERGALTVKDEDTGRVFSYDEIIDGFIKV